MNARRRPPASHPVSLPYQSRSREGERWPDSLRPDRKHRWPSNVFLPFLINVFFFGICLTGRFWRITCRREDVSLRPRGSESGNAGFRVFLFFFEIPSKPRRSSSGFPPKFVARKHGRPREYPYDVITHFSFAGMAVVNMTC